jgi:hypothetical protein
MRKCIKDVAVRLKRKRAVNYKRRHAQKTAKYYM